jgi:hypothetical protein
MIRKQIKTGEPVNPKEDRMLKEVYRAGMLQGYDVGKLMARGRSMAEGRIRRSLLEEYGKEIDTIEEVLKDKTKREKLSLYEFNVLKNQYRSLKIEEAKLLESYDRWREVTATTKKGLTSHQKIEVILNKSK